MRSQGRMVAELEVEGQQKRMDYKRPNINTRQKAGRAAWSAARFSFIAGRDETRRPDPLNSHHRIQEGSGFSAWAQRCRRCQ